MDFVKLASLELQADLLADELETELLKQASGINPGQRPIQGSGRRGPGVVPPPRTETKETKPRKYLPIGRYQRA